MPSRVYGTAVGGVYRVFPCLWNTNTTAHAHVRLRFWISEPERARIQKRLSSLESSTVVRSKKTGTSIFPDLHCDLHYKLVVYLIAIHTCWSWGDNCSCFGRNAFFATRWPTWDDAGRRGVPRHTQLLRFCHSRFLSFRTKCLYSYCCNYIVVMIWYCVFGCVRSNRSFYSSDIQYMQQVPSWCLPPRETYTVFRDPSSLQQQQQKQQRQLYYSWAKPTRGTRNGKTIYVQVQYSYR